MEKKLLGRRIHIARKDKGMTGGQLAEVCNINATYLLADVLNDPETRDIEGEAKKNLTKRELMDRFESDRMLLS